MQTLGLLFKMLSFAVLFSVLWTRGLLGVIIVFTVAAVLFFIGACIEDMPSRTERKIKEKASTLYYPNGQDREEEIFARTMIQVTLTPVLSIVAVTLLFIFVFNEAYALIELIVLPIQLFALYLFLSGRKKYERALKEFDEIDDTHTANPE